MRFTTTSHEQDPKARTVRGLGACCRQEGFGTLVRDGRAPLLEHERAYDQSPSKRHLLLVDSTSKAPLLEHERAFDQSPSKRQVFIADLDRRSTGSAPIQEPSHEAPHHSSHELRGAG